MATIRKLKRKRGEAYELDYRDPNTGRRCRKVIHCDHKTAVAICKDIDARIARKEYGIGPLRDKNVLWESVTERYLSKSEKTKSPETTKREHLVIKTFSSFIGNPDIREIETSKIEDYFHHRLKSDKIAPATAGIEFRVLRAIFYQAIRWKYIVDNPVAGVRIPNHRLIKVRYLTLEEIHRLLKVIPEGSFKSLVIAYMNTGARRNELLPPSFTWESVDFTQRRLYLKGKGGRGRYVPINDAMNRILRKAKADDLTVPFSFKPDYVSHKLADYYVEAQIKGANVHSLRKTFGSLLIQRSKADLYTISKLLGHSSIRTTEKYYVDLLDENYHQSVGHLDDILPKASLEKEDV